MRGFFSITLALWFLGCGASPPAEPSCTGASDCDVGSICVDGQCRERPDGNLVDEDAGTEQDAGGPECSPSRVCGEACCDETESCSTDARCCARESICGGICCDGDSQICVAEMCLPDCGSAAACGEGADAVCCGTEQVCLLGECTDPGEECSGPFDCAEGQYCDSSIGRCLPRVTGSEACEYRPTTGDFELEVEWHWTGDPDVKPEWNQVMSAPMVANLNDDNGDDRIDENDIPDVVFNTFHRSSPNRDGAATYNVDGVLRAISGADGSRLWPTEDPTYATHPGLEVAIADVRAESPGPEIIGCTMAPGSLTATPRLTIFSNEGTILHRFDSGVSIGCGRPAVADMNGDGVAELVVNNEIVQADASGSVTATLNATNRIPVLYDIDDEPALELIGINGVANHDGTVLWQNTEHFVGESGYTAVADMDRDGDADIVAVSVQSHAVIVWEAATGTLLFGPTEITPVADAAIAARVAAEMARRPDRDALRGGGPPTIANFDDDVDIEFSLAGGYAYSVFERDTTTRWYLETRDQSSRATGSSVFDFEGDGVAEVLYNDEYVFRSFRGPTGEIYLDRCNTSGTLTEYPIVVDVDNDDHAEVVLVENNYARSLCDDGTASTTGVRAFGHPTDQWVRTRRIWNQHSYHVTNINEDGTLPLVEERNYLNPRLNNFRQNIQPDGLFDAPDLVLRDPSFSTAACAEEGLILRVRAVNVGRAGARAGVPISFFVDGTYVGQEVTSRTLLPGASEIVELLYSPVVLGTTYAFEAVINDPERSPVEGLNECRPDNNGTDEITAACPEIL